MQKVAVSFPCIHPATDGELITITCFAAREMKGTIKIPAIDNEDVARRVIGATRHDETDHRAATGVIAMFSNPRFTGLSYTLALAIADKMARYPHTAPAGKIYATGSIAHDRQGNVGAISGITEKTKLILENARPGDCFLYPQANDEPELKPLLSELTRTGVDCIAIGHIDDLQGFLWHAPQSARSGKIRNWLKPGAALPVKHPRSLRTLSLAVLLAIATAAAFYLSLPNHEPGIEPNAEADMPPTTMNSAGTSPAAAIPSAIADPAISPQRNPNRKPAKRQLESGDIDLGVY